MEAFTVRPKPGDRLCEGHPLKKGSVCYCGRDFDVPESHQFWLKPDALTEEIVCCMWCGTPIPLRARS